VITGTLAANVAGVATTDVLNLTLNGGNHAGNNITTGNFETLNIASNTAANILGTITMTPTAAQESIGITGAQNLTLGVVTTDKIDASAFTGNLAMVTGTVAAGGINILGGSGTDTLWGGAAADIISGGAGVDRIQGVAAGGANQADVLTGGAGIDTFVFQDDFAANASISNVTFGTLTKISDFVAGTDKISLIDTAGAFTSITLGTAQTQATAATLAAMAAAITAIGVSADGGAASAVVVTVSAGAVAGTYLYINDTAAGPVSVTNDTFIDLTGITGTLVATDFLFA
jgi:Ca2+-binding RTX toxin-like protein